MITDYRARSTNYRRKFKHFNPRIEPWSKMLEFTPQYLFGVELSPPVPNPYSYRRVQHPFFPPRPQSLAPTEGSIPLFSSLLHLASS
ncbi:hypothetical protein AVEN_29802-1 [Araneus ventricosus]|uniref:Uncharacterized protein n=1 Tax=Araneus ventricosus TaxID=182803 RepID=A0A4Y2GH59_ARAVE|nr:hypothetical protein AVEN_29802-1 [Araneus ventricosus]